MSRRTVLVVEDERDLAELLAYNLKREGYDAHVAHDGAEALERVASLQPDLVLLDIMMPELNGQQVVQRLRASESTRRLPVIMLTAKTAESDEVELLTTGADDYITKPFSMKLLLARLAAVLRRADQAAQLANASVHTAPIEADADDTSLAFGPITIDGDRHEVLLDNRPLSLTVTEFRLLRALVEAQGKVLSRRTLIRNAMGPGVTVTERTIDVHVTSIRKKFGEMAWLVRTVRGVGYRMSVEEPQATSAS